MEENAKKVLSRLQALCSKREYCSLDILTKAKKALDGDAEVAADILHLLQKEKYVDDRRYAAAYAREKASVSGWGKVKISYFLSSKGISRDIIEEAFEDIDERSADRRLESLLRAKLKSLKDDPQRKIKLLRFALGRGYSYDELKSPVESLLREYSDME